MFKKGEIYLANLNPRKENEIGKLRPVLIYQTDMLNDVEHLTTTILPLTTSLLEDMYPLRYRVSKRDKLDKDSDVVCDHLRTIDNKRIKEGKIATLTLQEILEIDNQILLVLGIEQ